MDTLMLDDFYDFEFVKEGVHCEGSIVDLKISGSNDDISFSGNIGPFYDEQGRVMMDFTIGSSETQCVFGSRTETGKLIFEGVLTATPHGE